MNTRTVRPPAAVAGCLLLVLATSAWYGTGLPVYVNAAVYNGFGGFRDLPGWLLWTTPALVTALGSCLSRWWPYLLAAGALMAVPIIVSDFDAGISDSVAVAVLPSAGYYLTIVALLACAQGLVRTAAGRGATVAALILGSQLVGSAMADGNGWNGTRPAAYWHVGLLVAGLTGLAPAAWRMRRGDPSASGPAAAVATTVGPRPWRCSRPLRLVIAATLATGVPIPLMLLTTQRLADLLGINAGALHGDAQKAAIGAITLVAVAVLAAATGRWSLAGALTAAVVQVALAPPAVLAFAALRSDTPVRWTAALAGAVLGAAAAACRWRIPAAATLTVLAATALFIAYGATTGQPQKLMDQGLVIPAVLILVLCTAAAGGVFGATAPMLGARGALPAALGPLAGMLAVSGLQTLQLTYVIDGVQQSAFNLATSALLLLTAGAAIGALGFAQQVAARRAERRRAEEAERAQAERIRHEAAVAERDRLARPIHDGVLQVLALMQRHGSELGDQGRQLAALAGEQELALRTLLTGGTAVARARPGTGTRVDVDADTGTHTDADPAFDPDAACPPESDPADLRPPLQALAAAAVNVATPAQPVTLPAATVAEVAAAVRAALDNVRCHAGSAAQAWILLEDESDGVRVTIRDDGAGFPPQRLAEAAATGRLGVAQSMRGRIADCGGTTSIHGRPGEGTEVEFWLPRDRAQSAF